MTQTGPIPCKVWKERVVELARALEASTRIIENYSPLLNDPAVEWSTIGDQVAHNKEILSDIQDNS